MSMFPTRINKSCCIYFIDEIYILIINSNAAAALYDYNFKCIATGDYFLRCQLVTPLKFQQISMYAIQIADSNLYPHPRSFALGMIYSSDVKRPQDLWPHLDLLSNRDFASTSDTESGRCRLSFNYEKAVHKKRQKIYKIPKNIHIMYWHTSLIKPQDITRYMLIKHYSFEDVANIIMCLILEHVRLDTAHYPIAD